MKNVSKGHISRLDKAEKISELADISIESIKTDGGTQLAQSVKCPTLAQV